MVRVKSSTLFLCDQQVAGAFCIQGLSLSQQRIHEIVSAREKLYDGKSLICAARATFSLRNKVRPPHSIDKIWFVTAEMEFSKLNLCQIIYFLFVF